MGVVRKDTKLVEFISHARQKGMDHNTIRVLLLSAGWKEREIARGLASQGLDLPVPEPPAAGGAREAFQHLTAFSALYVLVINVILILFQFLDDLLPDRAVASLAWLSEYRQGYIRWSIAMVIVAAPLFFGFSRWIGRDIHRSPERSKSPIRRWLTFLTLFAAAITMMIDGATLVYGFLQGDLTTRFLLKTLLVLGLAALVFSYYMLSLRPVELAPSRLVNWIFGGTAAAIMGVAVTLGFLLVESPFTARLRKFDERRIADLQAISSAIDRQVVALDSSEPQKKKLKGPLPATLVELDRFVRNTEHSGPLSLHDPQTGKAYEYAVKSESSYELGAEFSLAGESRESLWTPYGSREWNHPAGHYCFTIDVLKP